MNVRRNTTGKRRVSENKPVNRRIVRTTLEKIIKPRRKTADVNNDKA